MSTQELFGELRKLNRADKLRAMELLVLALAAEEEIPLGLGATYEVWSPFDSAGTANDLLRLLDEVRQPNNGWR